TVHVIIDCKTCHGVSPASGPPRARVKILRRWRGLSAAVGAVLDARGGQVRPWNGRRSFTLERGGSPVATFVGFPGRRQLREKRVLANEFVHPVGMPAARSCDLWAQASEPRDGSGEFRSRSASWD